jgi:hypothetical protein
VPREVRSVARATSRRRMQSGQRATGWMGELSPVCPDETKGEQVEP